MVFDKNSKTPIYFQLKQILKNGIQDGEYLPGQLLPSERELCAQYDISRMTARQAINELQNEGYLYKIQGKGTFVSSHKIEQNLALLTSFSEDMQRMGRQPGSKILAIENLRADTEIADKLQIDVGKNVLLLSRLRYAGTQPISIENSYLNADLIKRIDTGGADNFSLYRYLREELHIQLASAHETIETTPITGKRAKLLEVPENAAGLLMERITRNENNTPIEYVKSFYRGDLYKFSIELKSMGG